MKNFITLYICLFFSIQSLSGQQVDHLDVYSESMLYVSGDLLRVQIVPVDENGAPVAGRHLISAYLVSHNGQILSAERFLITDLDKSGAVYLPIDLETGVLKFVAFLPGADNQTEVNFYVYNPSIFSSSIAPDNADLAAGIDQLTVNGTVSGVLGRTDARMEYSLKPINPEVGVPGIGVVKVYNEKLDTAPSKGKVVRTTRREESNLEFDLKLVSDHPNSRVSFYFLDQAVVEEYYLADEEQMMKGLREHYGSGPVYAYQFAQDGSRLKEIDIDITSRNKPVFSSFDNSVPFNTEIQEILENKRIRKFIDQVYRNQNDQVVSLLEEEYDRTPDSSTFPDRYEGIATLRELLASIVPKSQVIRRDGKYEVRLSPSNSGFRYSESPFILINGVPTFEIDSLIDMPVQDVEVVHVFNSIDRLRRFGTLGRFGVLSIKLKKEVANPISEKLNQLPVIPGISDLVQDVSGVVPKDTPDLRPVLLWDPSFRFYPNQPRQILLQDSDLNGNYRLFGELIMPDGTRKFISDTFNLEIAR